MRIQYSLKSFLGLVLIVGLSLGWWVSSARYEVVRQRQGILLKDWVQPLEVEDPRAIYYRILPLRSGGLERWKVHLPHGKKYELQCVIHPTIEVPRSKEECIVARIPMNSGRSIFQANWRRDSQGIPLVSIAVLGPTPKQTITQRAQFPPEFREFFSRRRGLSETIRGYEGTAFHVPGPWVTFVTSLTYYGPKKMPTGEVVNVLGGFEVWIRTIEEEALTKTSE